MLPIKVMRTGSGGGGGGDNVQVPAGTYNHTAIDPADALCTLQFNPDGTVATSAGVSPSPPDWEFGGAPGANYDISFNAGSSWATLGSAQSISKSRTVQGTTTQTYDVRIRRASDLVQVAVGTITLEAVVEI